MTKRLIVWALMDHFEVVSLHRTEAGAVAALDALIDSWHTGADQLSVERMEVLP